MTTTTEEATNRERVRARIVGASLTQPVAVSATDERVRTFTLALADGARIEFYQTGIGGLTAPIAIVTPEAELCDEALREK